MADIKARQRARDLVRARGLGALANDTKWSEFVAQVQAHRIPLEVKLLYEAFPSRNGCVWSPSVNYLEGSGLGPELFVFIEWCRSEDVMQMQDAAAAIGLECEVRDGKATVYEYR